MSNSEVEVEQSRLKHEYCVIRGYLCDLSQFFNAAQRVAIMDVCQEEADLMSCMSELHPL